MPPTRIDATHFSPDIRSFIGLLERHDVRYLIVDGEAVILHGHVRLKRASGRAKDLDDLSYLMEKP